MVHGILISRRYVCVVNQQFHVNPRLVFATFSDFVKEFFRPSIFYLPFS